MVLFSEKIPLSALAKYTNMSPEFRKCSSILCMFLENKLILGSVDTAGLISVKAVVDNARYNEIYAC